MAYSISSCRLLPSPSASKQRHKHELKWWSFYPELTENFFLHWKLLSIDQVSSPLCQRVVSRELIPLLQPDYQRVHLPGEQLMHLVPVDLFDRDDVRTFKVKGSCWKRKEVMSISLMRIHTFGNKLRKKLTNASAIDPFSPDSTRLSISALYSGPPPRRLSRVQRGMPKSTIEGFTCQTNF